MTREAVIQNMDDRFAGKPVIGIYELIDRIYDDFESQICENCNHFVKTTCPIIEMESYDEVKNPFGCNRFERSKL